MERNKVNEVLIGTFQDIINNTIKIYGLVAQLGQSSSLLPSG